MVRISDIFKKTAGNAGQHPAEPLKPEGDGLASNSQSHKKGPSLEPKPEIPHALADSRFKEAGGQKGQTETGAHQQKCVPGAMDRTAADSARSHNLYLLGVQLIRDVFLNIEQLKPINLVQLKQWVENIVNCLIPVDTELLNLFYGYASENYLYEHMVNAAIMSIEIGLGLGYNQAQLNELGLAAFLHDIGMIKVAKLETQQRKLTEEEYNQIKNHPLYGAEILSKIKDIPESVIFVVKEEHERENGSGYPKGFKDGEISEYGRIVAIADVYEALTHNRPQRKKFPPHAAVKELITNDFLYDPLILKVLINRVGVYPVSSLVELNSNEIGRVAMNNAGFPLRPVLQVLFDAKKKRLKNPHCVNLAEQFNLFIKRVISDEELAGETK